jgi:hypothetical protein
VKSSSARQQGILQEVMGLMQHEIRRVSQYLWGCNLISDDFLAVELAKRLHQTPTTVARALHDYTNIALGNCMKASHMHLPHPPTTTHSKWNQIRILQRLNLFPNPAY